MVKVKNSKGKEFLIPKSMYESDFKFQGYTLCEENERVAKDEKKDSEIEELLLIPVEEMNKTQLKKIAVYKNLDFKNCKNLEEVREVVKNALY